MHFFFKIKPICTIFRLKIAWRLHSYIMRKSVFFYKTHSWQRVRPTPEWKSNGTLQVGMVRWKSRNNPHQNCQLTMEWSNIRHYHKSEMALTQYSVSCLFTWVSWSDVMTRMRAFILVPWLKRFLWMSFRNNRNLKCASPWSQFAQLLQQLCQKWRETQKQWQLMRTSYFFHSKIRWS